jgi:hypothetical protein
MKSKDEGQNICPLISDYLLAKKNQVLIASNHCSTSVDQHYDQR